MDVEFSDSRDVRDLRDRNRSRGFGSCRDFHFPYNRERVVIFRLMSSAVLIMVFPIMRSIKVS